MTERKPKVGFIGAGRLASVLAPALERSGYTVHAVTSRSAPSARRLAALLDRRPRVCATAQAVAGACDLVFITTPDDAIARVAGSVRWRPGQAAVHTSGALTTEALAPVRAAGGSAGGFHPLQTFAAPGPGKLAGATVAIEAGGPLGELLERMAADLGCRPIRIRPENKALYHVSGVLASNYIVALAGAAASLLEEQGLPRQRALEALLPLLRESVANLERQGLPGSLTGPVARGDAGTIARHLEELSRRAPHLLPAYRALGLLALPIAQERREIDEVTAKRIHGLLSASPGRVTQEVRA